MTFKVKLFGKNIFRLGDSYQKKANLEDYYWMTVRCKNCNIDIDVAIKKGVHLNDVITGVKCNNCECRLEKI
jgi:hypothetical protein